MKLDKLRCLSDFLKYFPSTAKFPVNWGEMDAFQHINNSVYFRYQETSRRVYFNKMVKNLKHDDYQYGLDFIFARGVGPILRSSSMTFKHPLKYPETVLVGTKIIMPNDKLNNQITLEHGVWGMNCKRLATTGTGTIVAFDYKLNKKADSFPECVLESFAKLNEQNSLCMLEDLEKEFCMTG